MLFALGLASAVAFGQPPPESAIAEQVSLAAEVTRESGEAATIFSTETAKIYLRWQNKSLPTGTKLRCLWIAEDVGHAAPPGYHVDEASALIQPSIDSGTFSLSRPKNGWPPGKYAVEIYAGDKLVQTLSFTVEQPRGD